MMSLLIIVYLCKTLALDTGLYRLQIMTERPARFFDRAARESAGPLSLWVVFGSNSSPSKKERRQTAF